MSAPPPVEVVRRLFEARAAGDVRRVRALMDPDVSFARGTTRDARVEVDAHRLEPEDDETVVVYGRVRVIEQGGITDSPAAWRMTVRSGRVAHVVPLDTAARRLRRAA